jgi:hypothetical protein
MMSKIGTVEFDYSRRDLEVTGENKVTNDTL